MCGYGGFGGGHMISFLFMLILVCGAIYFLKRCSFCGNTQSDSKTDPALSEEIKLLRKEIEMLKQANKE